MAEIWSDIPESDRPWYERRIPTEGRATFLPFRDTMEGSVFNEREFALPAFIAEIINAFTAPGRSLTQTGFDPAEEAANLAMNVGGGGLFASRARPVGGFDLGMFAGRNAKTANLSDLRRFNEMRQQGALPAQSYQETGWMLGAEGQPKFEISDDLATVSSPKLSQAELVDDIARTNLGSLLNHPELYAAYPELQHYSVYLSKPEGASGAFIPSSKAFQIDPRELDPKSPFYSPEKAKNLLLHETQHAIQRLENFETGGNPKFARDVLAKQMDVDLSQFDPDLDYIWKSGMSDLTFASKVDYAKSLDKLINSENIKPSRVTNMTDWYAYSDKIRSEYGVPPKKPGAERDEWYRNAARYMQEQTLKEPNVRSAYETMSDKDIRKMLREADKTLDSVKKDYTKYKEAKGKYSSLKKLSDEELYKRLAGEAESRLTETRSQLTPEQRRSQFPLNQLDVEYYELLYPSIMDSIRKGLLD